MGVKIKSYKNRVRSVPGVHFDGGGKSSLTVSGQASSAETSLAHSQKGKKFHLREKVITFEGKVRKS